MNRRGFVATVLGAITAGLSRPWWARGVEPHVVGNVGAMPTVNGCGCIAPGTVVSVPDGLMFHKDAFAMTMAPITAVEGRGDELFVVSGVARLRVHGTEGLGVTRLINTYGHKPGCNDAGNPPGCTCEEEAQAIMKQHVDALTERIDREGVERFYKTLTLATEPHVWPAFEELTKKSN